MNLRCWARHVADDTLCERACDLERHIHIGNHPRANVDVSWIDEYCARDAGPSDRETAALRILELSHEIDRVAFLAGMHTTHAALVRAVAARLMVDAKAASADAEALDMIAKCVSDLNESDHWECVYQPTMVLLQQAVEILRPFAEGR